LLAALLLIAVGNARAQGEGGPAAPTDPSSSSLLLMPTGSTLPAGTGCAGLAAPYIPYGAYSVAEGMQLSAGGVYIFKNAQGSAQAYYTYLLGKYQAVTSEQVNISLGAALMLWGQERLPSSVHAGRTWDRIVVPGVFAVATVGDESESLSFGAGFGQVPEGYSIGFAGGMVNGVGVGYKTRLGRKSRFITEHFIDAGTAHTLHTMGVRFFSNRGAFDLGVIVIPFGPFRLWALPVVGVSLHIG
jgi:hypothetical protein